MFHHYVCEGLRFLEVRYGEPVISVCASLAVLRYTGIESHPGLARYGLYDTVVTVEGATL